MLVHAITTNAAYEFASDVRAGLTRAGQKELLSKYLYDDVGSALFEVISRLPEYGLTRADERLLRRHASEIVDSLAMPVAVAELGSGSGKKARWVLEALCRKQRTFYYPVEISRSALVMCERELSDIDSISILGFEREYLDGLLEVAAQRRDRQHLLVLFLGSTIGNFDRPAGVKFLAAVRRILELLVLTGSRPDEVMTAEWPMFDLQRGIWNKPSHHVKQKKAEHPPLNDAALAILLRMWEDRDKGSIYLFPNSKGDGPRGRLYCWTVICKDAGLSVESVTKRREKVVPCWKPKYRLYDLRHSFASHLVSRGVSLPMIGKLMGHVLPATTARYAHVDNAALRAVVNQLPEIMPQKALVGEMA